MNISYNWLKKYINLNNSADEVAKQLTSIGLEVGTVEKIQSIKGGLEGLVVGEVITCDIHPNSDHLHITTVNIGQPEPLKIVCGAANVAVGQKVVVATIGTTLYDGDGSFIIKKSRLRGEDSYGMLCAEDEIGVGSSHEGIIVLPQDTPVGTLAKDYYNVTSDYIIEVDITPNRNDATSHFGVARDLAAYYSLRSPEIKLKKPSVDNFKIDNNSCCIPVEIIAKDACVRYSGITISGVAIKESPDWLKTCMAAVGLHSINNVVDATNYVLHSMGQPIHAFDADKISGGKIFVKKVAEGTPFKTLDGIERRLSNNDLVICDDKGPMCLAGVFGGFDSGVSETTKNIFIESACFDPVFVRKTARRHGLQTDASFRYERGCDPNNTLYILKFAVLAIQAVAGGKVSSEIVDVYPKIVEKPVVELTYKKLDSLTGLNIDRNDLKSILKALEMEILNETTESLTIAIPTYRVDVIRDADVIEDVLRIYGYDKVKFDSAVNSSLSFLPKPNSYKLQNIIAGQLTACGFNEVLNNSLTKESYYSNLTSYKIDNCVKLINPLSKDLSVLRQTMLFSGLENIAFNRNHKNFNLKFYEYGNCYYFHKENYKEDNHTNAYSEDYHLALWYCGDKEEQSWMRGSEKSSFYQLKAYVQNILERVGVNLNTLTLDAYKNDLMSEAQTISFKNKQIVMLGIVSKKILKIMDIDSPVYYADINWNNLLKVIKNNDVTYYDIPRFPEVRRDLALLIDKNINFSEIEIISFNTEKKLLKSVNLFDVYEGNNLPAGKKSYAVSFILQDENKTLVDKQIDNIMGKIQKALEDKLGAQLR